MSALKRLANILLAIIAIPFMIVFVPFFAFIDYMSGCEITAHTEAKDWWLDMVKPV